MLACVRLFFCLQCSKHQHSVNHYAEKNHHKQNTVANAVERVIVEKEIVHVADLLDNFYFALMRAADVGQTSDQLKCCRDVMEPVIALHLGFIIQKSTDIQIGHCGCQ